MDFLKNFIIYLENLGYTDLLIAFGYIFAFGLAWFFTSFALKRRFSELPQIKAIVYAAQAVIFTAIGIVSYKHIHDPILKLLYRDTAISITAILLANAVFSFCPKRKFLKFLTYLGLLGALVVEIAVIFTPHQQVVQILIPLRKFLILLALYPIIDSLIELISTDRLKKVLKTFSLPIFSAVGFLWEINRINFDITAFIGLAIIITATLLYSWFISHGVIFLKRYLKGFGLSDDDTEGLVESLTKLAFLLLLYVYWSVGISYLNLGDLIYHLREITIVDTDLVRISLYNLLVSVFLFFTFYYTLGVLKKAVKLLFPPESRDDKGGSLEAVIYNLGMLLNVTASLSAIGLSWKAILPLAGALGIGLGFGLQTILNNYVSGFILMFSRNIKVGDFVELPGNAGKFVNNDADYIFGRVEDISILTTRIKTLDGIDILVPNSTFVGNQIINYSLRSPYVRIRFPFGVAYSSDPERVKEILLKLAYDCPWAKNFYKPPAVWFSELGDSALIFNLLFWIDIRELWRNPHAVKSFSVVDWVYTNGFKRLKEAGVEIPFPQNDIWFRNKLKVVIENGEGKKLGEI